MKRFLIFTISCFIILHSGYSQCYPDRHNTNWFDAWVSCQASQNPNPVRGVGHWIQYDFGQVYLVGESHFWNANVPDFTNRGLNQIVIDYSADGVNWNELGVFNLAESNGSAFYEGISGPDFNGAKARYVLITANSNHGGDCYSLAEIRFNVQNSAVPVELVEFKAKCGDQKDMVISWKTAFEINNDYFSIERSQDGRNWNEISQIQGNGQSFQTSEYSFQDYEYLPGSNFYRLVQFDRDGEMKILGITEIECNDIRSELTAYPNPFNNTIRITLNNSAKGEIHYALLDGLGKKVKQGSIEGNNTVTSFELFFEELIPGQYILKVEQGNAAHQLKLVHF